MIFFIEQKSKEWRCVWVKFQCKKKTFALNSDLKVVVNVTVVRGVVFIVFFVFVAVAQNSIRDRLHPPEPIPFHRYPQPASINRNIAAL